MGNAIATTSICAQVSECVFAKISNRAANAPKDTPINWPAVMHVNIHGYTAEYTICKHARTSPAFPYMFTPFSYNFAALEFCVACGFPESVQMNHSDKNNNVNIEHNDKKRHQYRQSIFRHSTQASLLCNRAQNSLTYRQVPSHQAS